MKGFVLSAIAFAAMSASASTTKYLIKTQIIVDGKVVSQPQIVALENESAEFGTVDENPHKEVKLRVLATDAGSPEVHDAILMRFHVEYLSPERSIRSAPQILAKSGSEATLRLADRQGDKDVQMKVSVIRQ